MLAGRCREGRGMGGCGRMIGLYREYHDVEAKSGGRLTYIRSQPILTTKEGEQLERRMWEEIVGALRKDWPGVDAAIERVRET